ncbi:MAG: OadG family protein [Lachnospiraceae bacterium]|nr:OadG family protein [Lachnospiraceae bacterium]
MDIFNLVFLAAEETESLGDTMARAGLNTAMGIGIVFMALAFISIVIALEGKIFKSIDKRKAKKAEQKVETKPAESEPVTEVVDESDDLELVAVITAAIYAFSAEAGEAVPADGLVVRSIRRRQ